MIYVIVEGGLVDSIETDDDTLVGAVVRVIDHDTESAPEEDLGLVIYKATGEGKKPSIEKPFVREACIERTLILNSFEPDELDEA